MGFNRVYVLDGGLPQWIEEDRIISSRYQAEGVDYGPTDVDTLADVLQYHPERVMDAEAVLKRIEDPDTAIIDARGAPRFLGQVSEPRPGVRSGHILARLTYLLLKCSMVIKSKRSVSYSLFIKG